ncbi:hypothetical protein I79_004559 [Cricetulus griseus]|uniref:Uncharacterized protein n=1 Tax=Cricetulus griseus TaxID=10029 RepID=G3H2V6_CRIGR|nr:hypothetical protein I79_004559 [Cricetulus griseus]
MGSGQRMLGKGEVPGPVQALSAADIDSGFLVTNIQHLIWNSEDLGSKGPETVNWGPVYTLRDVPQRETCFLLKSVKNSKGSYGPLQTC